MWVVGIILLVVAAAAALALVQAGKPWWGLGLFFGSLFVGWLSTKIWPPAPW